MPGLIRGVARTAVVAGTATAVSNRVSRRQGERWQRQEAREWEEQQQAEPAPAAAAPQKSTVEQLRELGQLREQGILTDEEFAAEKAKILRS